MRPLLGPFKYTDLGRDVPKAPCCTVTLSWDAHTDDFTAILDSGADMTCIPKRLVDAFSLIKTDEVDFGGVKDTECEKRSVYGINLECMALGFHFPFMEVMPIEGLATNTVLIGRDILNRYRVTLDGPGLEFTIL